jgi:hypothetical protein
MRPSFHPTDRGKMDAKTIRALVWLAALSLFCATTAWAVDHAVFGSVFAALGIVAILGCSPEAPALTPANWVKLRGLCVMPHVARIVIIPFALVAASCSAEQLPLSPNSGTPDS